MSRRASASVGALFCKIRFKVLDANGQALGYVYSRDTKDAADIVLTEDEARRIASNIAKLPELLGASERGRLFQ